MDPFIVLLKKRLLQKMTLEDENEFERILDNDPDLQTMYLQFFSKNNRMSKEEMLEAEEAFAVHFVKIQLKK